MKIVPKHCAATCCLATKLIKILEKYGTNIYYDDETVKTVTLQMYLKEVNDDSGVTIVDDNGLLGSIMLNTAFTVTKQPYGIYIGGFLLDDNNNFLPFIDVSDGDYNNGLMLYSNYEFDLHVIKV